MIRVNLAYEDVLSHAVQVKILGIANKALLPGIPFSRGGFGYLKKNIRTFNQASRSTPYFLLTDLDTYECPPELIEDWINIPLQKNFLFRIAIRSVEAWLLADRMNIASFLKVSPAKIGRHPDSFQNPKAVLLSIAAVSRSRSLRDALVRIQGNILRAGPDYNGTLIQFVNNYWNPLNAAEISDSLRRTIEAIKSFSPQITHKQRR